MTTATRKRPKHPLDHDPEAVANARGESGLTRTRLAEICGVSRSLISEIELGTRNATPEMILKLAAVLKCKPADLERKREPEAQTAGDVDVPDLPARQRGVADDLLEREQSPEAATAKEVRP